jgi:hypothetical protein
MKNPRRSIRYLLIAATAVAATSLPHESHADDGALLVPPVASITQ